MARDPRKLRVFKLADDLVPDVYELTRKLPPEEKYGLMSQIRRASISVPTNIVEGCARSNEGDYLRFMTIANGSAYEAGYLLGLCVRLDFLDEKETAALVRRFGHVAASLTALIESIKASASAARKEAVGVQKHSPRA